ncbi:unnamed protein product [Closterium sp. NIES-54]
MWIDDLQLYLLSDFRDNVLLFDHTSGASLTPPATTDSATRSQWLTSDGAARLAVRNHLLLAKRAHFGKHKTAKALYDAVVTRYSSPATAALSCLILPYLFLELSAFTTVEDLVTHLHTSDARYRAALPAEFLDRNPPLMYITLYFIVTHLPDSLRVVKDHFLALDPTDLIVLLVALLAHPSLRGVPPPPLPPPTLLLLLLISLALTMSGLLLLLVGSAAAARARVARVVAVAAGVVVVGSVQAVDVAEVVAAVGVVVGVGASMAGVVAAVGVVVAVVAVVGVVAVGVELSRGEVLAVARGSSISVRTRPLRPSSFVSEAAALGATESALPGTASAEAVHTFTLDSGASRCFFCDSTTITPLLACVPVRLADPSRGPVLACSSTVLPLLLPSKMRWSLPPLLGVSVC